MTLDISASGNSGDLSYSIDDFEIYVGKGVDIKSFGFVAHGFVVSVDEE